MLKTLTKIAFFTTVVVLITAQSETVVLQQGLDGYTGCEDQELRDPARNYFGGPDEEILVLSEW